MSKKRRVLRSEYRKSFPKGDKLGRVASLIDWNAFKPILEPLFKNTGEGRPHIDVILMTKVLVLQAWYGLADEAVEMECKDRLTFQNFLGYPVSLPDAKTIWLFKERVAEKGKEKELWDELQRQLKKYRVVVKKGQIKDAVLIELGGWRMDGQEGPIVEVAPHLGYAQDSTIIGADPGVPTEEELKRLKEIEEKNRKQKEEQRKRKEGERGANHGESSSTTKQETVQESPRRQPATPQEQDDGGGGGGGGGALPPAIAATSTKPKPRGDDAKTRRSRDGTWTKKHGKSFFGYKLHTKDDLASGYITEMEVTTASVNDNNIDLTKKREVCVRDRGYSQGGKGHCISMIKATRGHPLNKEDKQLNKFLAKVRAPVEHPFATIKRIFHCERVLVTTVGRVRVRLTFVCTCYNLFRTLKLASVRAK